MKIVSWNANCKFREPFHIDHCFSNPKNIQKMTIHARWQWLALSDHLPIEIYLINN